MQQSNLSETIGSPTYSPRPFFGSKDLLKHLIKFDDNQPCIQS